MRKFILMIAAALICSFATAQTVENSRLFDNTFIGVYGGGVTTNLTTTHRTFFWNGVKDIAKGVRPVGAVEFGKYVTPVVGFGLEGQAIFNTTHSNTFVDQSNVIANVKFNLSNLLGGYPGQPRLVEVVVVPGLGWGHNYGHAYDIPRYDKNYLTYKAGAEVNFNVADRWQINVRPAAIWWNYNNVLRFDRRNLQAQVLVGATYKFGNFKLCPYSVTASEYNTLQNKVKDLQDALAAKPKEVVVEKEVIVEKVVEKEIPAAEVISVNFEKNSSRLYPEELVELNNYLKGVKKDARIVITGSADTKTGTKVRNQVLARQRADAVKKYLESLGYTNVETATELDVYENRVRSRVAIIK